jgi:polysaccharide biosynthesis/export protein
MQLVFPHPDAKPRSPYRLVASSLSLLYSSASILATIAVYQVAQTGAATASTSQPPLTLPVLESAIAQTGTQTGTQTPGLRPPGTPAARPTSRELLEQAKQQLRDRGELPPANPQDRSNLPPNTSPSRLPNDPNAMNSNRVPPLVPAVQMFSLYRLGPRDSVGIVVQRFADFNVQAVIDPEGFITHPILGKIYLQGLTIDQAQERIRQQVDRFIINPVVLVSLTNQRPVQVTLVGEVSKPGLYPLSQGPQLASALLAGGGTREDADLRTVVLRRPMPDGSIQEQSFDMFSALKAGTAMPNPMLQDGDTIYVPKLQVGDQTYDRTIASRSTLVRPQITVRVLSYTGGGLRQVPLANGSTFLDALSTTGLNPDQADMKKIALVRFDEQAQKAVTFTLNGRAALYGDMTQNMALQDNDVIIIGRNLVGRITQTLNVFTQPFRDVLGFLLFFRQLGDSATNLFGPTR